MEDDSMVFKVTKTDLYHYDLYVKWFLFLRKIGKATVSLDGKEISFDMPEKWWGYAKELGKYIAKKEQT